MPGAIPLTLFDSDDGDKVDFTPKDPHYAPPSRYLIWVHFLVTQVMDETKKPSDSAK
jgi:hypothetical protein